MKINPIYEYGPIEKTTKDDGARTYDTPDGLSVPSVTTILSKTKDMTFLKEWKKRIGEEKAQQIVNRSVRLGTGVHKNLENYILEGAEPTGDIFSIAMTKKIIQNGLAKVDEVWGVEVSLYAEGLYAGTTDCCGIFEKAPAIIDFKNSRSLRKEEWIEDYSYQVAAYSLAHNEMFGTNIKKGVIMIATQNGHYQEFIFEGKSYQKAVDGWAKRVEKYYAKYR